MKPVTLSKLGFALFIVGLFSYFIFAACLLQEEISGISVKAEQQLLNKAEHVANFLGERLKEICARVELLSLNPIIHSGSAQETADLLAQVLQIDALYETLLVLDSSGHVLAAAPAQLRIPPLSQNQTTCERLHTVSWDGEEYYAVFNSIFDSQGREGEGTRQLVVLLSLPRVAEQALPGFQPDTVSLLTPAEREIVLLPAKSFPEPPSFLVRFLGSLLRRNVQDALHASAAVPESPGWTIQLARPYNAFLTCNVWPVLSGFRYYFALVLPILLVAGFALLAIYRSSCHYREQARKDGLTGLYNHRYFQSELTAILKNAQNAPVSLLMLDLDDFKQYNDAHGHQAGDSKLKKVASVLLRSTSGSDLVARYGGEEFAAVLPGLGLERALEVAERIKEAVRTQCGVTSSIGVSSFPEYAGNAEDLIRTADQALYAAKGRSKDVVMSIAEMHDAAQ